MDGPGAMRPAAPPSPPRDALAQGRRIGRAGTWVIVLLFGGGLLWMSRAPLSAAVVMPASLVVENYRRPVQHLEGGIVREVLVRPGDRVQQGQPLLHMESVQADAGVQTLQDRLDAELARAARADGERLLKAQVDFPAELTARTAANPKLRALLASETELFGARRRQWTGQTALLRNQAEQVRAEIDGLKAQIAAADTSRALLERELEMNRDLLRREFVQQTRVMVLERGLAEKDEQRGEYAAELAKAQQKLVELDLKVISLQDDVVKRASDEHADAIRQVMELRERLRPLASTLARQTVTAPAAGEVVGLRVHAAGAVVPPGSVLMEIVPERPTLLVEGRARTDDAAELAVGQPVTVQVHAFKARSTPLLTGTVSYVSADSLAETVGGTSVAYYQVQATVDAASLAQLPRQLAPGMPATLFVQTVPRTALDYLLQPLTDAWRRSFTEP